MQTGCTGPLLRVGTLAINKAAHVRCAAGIKLWGRKLLCSGLRLRLGLRLGLGLGLGLGAPFARGCTGAPQAPRTTSRIMYIKARHAASELAAGKRARRPLQVGPLASNGRGGLAADWAPFDFQSCN